MHAQLAHIYHLALFGLDILLNPIWRAPAACVLTALACRLLGLSTTPRGAALTACGATLAGWALLDPHFLGYRPPPIARLPGLALILLLESAWHTSPRPRFTPLILVTTAALAAWWLRGAPATSSGILNCMPVFLGLLAAIPLARRLARNDAGWANIAAALALAGSLMVTGAATHWARAALVPACAAVALLGLSNAAPAIAATIAAAAASAIVASDRGRLIPVDAACAVPILAGLLTPRLTPRIARHTPAFAGLVAAALCIGLSWAATRAFAG